MALMVGIFGKREMELAALRIRDAGMLRRKFVLSDLGRRLDVDETYGLILLKQHGWIAIEGRPSSNPADWIMECTRAMIDRCARERRSKDRP